MDGYSRAEAWGDRTQERESQPLGAPWEKQEEEGEGEAERD